MHLLPADTRSLDAGEAAVDLGQAPGAIVFASLSDSDLALAAASGLDGLRIAPLQKLRHPMSVDLYVDSVARHAKAIVVRLLGGMDYWRYGVEEFAAAARSNRIALAFIPGDARPDGRLAALSTVPSEALERIDRYWREGGPANARASLLYAARLGGLDFGAPAAPAAMPKYGVFVPGGALHPPLKGEGRCEASGRGDSAGRSEFPPHPGPAAPHSPSRGVWGRAVILFYRSVLLSADTAPITALVEALEARGLDTTALYVGSLKEGETAEWVRQQLAGLKPAILLNATAFSAIGDDGASPLDAAGCPVLQVVTSSSAEEAWAASTRGLSASDLAMHVALPELDGRLLAGVISFKAERQEGGFARLVHAPHAGRIEAVARRAAAWARLAAKARGERRIGLVLSNYPGVEGRLAHAVGLDAPASTLAILDRLEADGYRIADRPKDEADLLDRLSRPSDRHPAGASGACNEEKGGQDAGGPGDLHLPLADYASWLETLPRSVRDRLSAQWGAPSSDPLCSGGAFRFAGLACGHVAVAVQPDRGSALDRKGDHHSPDLAPRHAYLAFYLWLRQHFGIDAMIHLGTHGTLEWLPGKAAALSEACFPEIAAGALPVLYPFIVNNPGEAAQAKRRLGAVTIGHLTPPLREAGLSGAALEVERLIDEYASADGLDQRRMAYLRREIVARAEESGLAAECGITPGLGEEDMLARLDAFLCDVKELQIRDGLHVFGRRPEQVGHLLDVLVASSGEAARPALARSLEACGEAEMAGLIAGLDGRFVRPGPAGAPTRGRADVLPTGRNLTTLDPRAVPTRAAFAIGSRAADALVQRYLQDHGDHPRRIVLDLWGSATMRTGGDDLGQALALLGVRPVWDNASSRVSGFEILPQARLDRPRIDVTLRISGLFRDVFAQQIALFDQAVQAVAALEEDEAWNPLAAARRRSGERALRVFGAAPAAYGAGITDRIARGAWESRADLGRDYLAAGAYAYGSGVDGDAAPVAFAERVASADAHVHGQDHRETDILDDVTFAAYQGGFAAALEALGAKAALYHADLTDPDAPKLRSLGEEIARLVQGRAASARWIEGMMQHGYAGAAEMANAMDSLFAFSATAGVVTNAAFDRMHAAYVEDEAVSAFLDRHNPAAGRAIRGRLAEAIRRGLWQPRRNSASLLLDEPREAAA
ncbi:cobaltochelatase subunit CobN [Labrys monachus]|uniref:Cobaltochelatase CobN n=1 Tax=Labrys monachus TaxID=217067 RepID=A0ABU0FD73_9HYPH|nr:cobaltochelatase subunit CobN [Labrys monachus]MDQ0392496.1 cobaltochelatase CobN [Labrys monachus]